MIILSFLILYLVASASESTPGAAATRDTQYADLFDESLNAGSYRVSTMKLQNNFQVNFNAEYTVSTTSDTIDVFVTSGEDCETDPGESGFSFYSEASHKGVSSATYKGTLCVGQDCEVTQCAMVVCQNSLTSCDFASDSFFKFVSASSIFSMNRLIVLLFFCIFLF